MEKLTLTLTFESPYTADGQPRQDLPTGEVLGWDGEKWANGWLAHDGDGFVVLCDGVDRQWIELDHVKRFAPLPTIIETDDLL